MNELTTDLEIVGRLEHASNGTYLARSGAELYVYKPVTGEQELWDFPTGTLANRERAAYVLDQLLGWDLIPETKLVTGPLGFGSLQNWVEAETGLIDIFSLENIPDDWFTILSGLDEQGKQVTLAHSPSSRLAQLAVLDVIMNNADRKAGHILVDEQGEVFGIDHGLTFSEEFKLRTVLWGWIGSPIEDSLIHNLNRIIPLIANSELVELLDAAEIDALLERARSLVSSKIFPEPSTQWSAVPWPIF